MANLSPFASDVMLQAFVAAANAGTASPNATLELYTAPVPNSPIDAPSGVLLAIFLMPDPAILGPANQVITLQLGGITSTVIADGRAAWARYRTKDSTTMFDGTVGLIGSGADIELEIIDLTTADILNPGNIPMRLRCPT